MKKQLPSRIHIGCGGVHLDGYLNIDIINENGAADELCDCTDIFTFHPEFEGKIEEILGLHVFEHFYKDEAIQALQQYYDMLRPDGRLILEMPDFKALCGLVLEGNTDDLTMGYVFGSHSRAGQTHFWGWSPETLRKELVKIGFNEIHVGQGTDYHAGERPCFRIEAVK